MAWGSPVPREIPINFRQGALENLQLILPGVTFTEACRWSCFYGWGHRDSPLRLFSSSGGPQMEESTTSCGQG